MSFAMLQGLQHRTATPAINNRILVLQPWCKKTRFHALARICFACPMHVGRSVVDCTGQARSAPATQPGTADELIYLVDHHCWKQMASMVPFDLLLHVPRFLTEQGIV